MTSLTINNHRYNVIMDNNADTVRDKATSNRIAAREGKIVISATVSIDMTEGTVAYGVRYSIPYGKRGR